MSGSRASSTGRAGRSTGSAGRRQTRHPNSAGRAGSEPAHGAHRQHHPQASLPGLARRAGAHPGRGTQEHARFLREPERPDAAVPTAGVDPAHVPRAGGPAAPGRQEAGGRVMQSRDPEPSRRGNRPHPGARKRLASRGDAERERRERFSPRLCVRRVVANAAGSDGARGYAIRSPGWRLRRHRGCR